MATTRSLTSAPAAPASLPPRHRLRAVDRDEVVTVADLLPPGATWLPAPQHALPVLPGRPPMVGYLVLVPADQQPPFPVAVPDPAGSPRPAPGPTATRRSGSTPCSAPPRSTDANSTSPTWSSSCSRISSPTRAGCTAGTIS
ncbi:hypothetical protein SHKM778_72860 [Streptomyces sp. KM77-8]|uniref:Uncharacterized protein n=1 Tax=Streptomyces haneummycinicus TaxID=3074435 RepID=A0AAT9HTW4_9ACTN